MQPQHMHNDIRKVKIDETVYTIKRLTPVDFIGGKNIVPFSLFTLAKKKGKTKFEQAQELLETDQDKESQLEKQSAEIATSMLDLVDRATIKVNEFDFDIKEFTDNCKNVKVLTILYEEIISFSCNLFKKLIELDEDNIKYINKVCAIYTMQPIDVIAGNENYTSMDAYLFNTIVAAQFMEEISLKEGRNIYSAIKGHPINTK